MNKENIKHHISNLTQTSDLTLAKLGDLAINAELNAFETQVVFLEITQRFINQVANHYQ